MKRRYSVPLISVVAFLIFVATASASTPGSDVRLSNDVGGGYVSAYTLATGTPYTDDTIDECSIARGRQNEPAVEVNPRDPRVLLGSANDYCGVYAGSPPGNFVAAGPIWLGYYRSEDGGESFQSSLVPGYPDDTSPYAALSRIRTAEAGDPVIAWDNHGRVFFGSESSADPAGSPKTFGDVFVATFDNPDGPDGDTLNDGKRFVGSAIVNRGSAAPNLLGLFNDKTSINADRTGTSCDGVVYFAWSRYTSNGSNNVYISRSTDHGTTWSTPKQISGTNHVVQFPDIAITGNGDVYVAWRQFESKRAHDADALYTVKSTDCGATYSSPKLVTTFLRNDAVDVPAPEPIPAPDGSPEGPEKGKDSGEVTSTPDDRAGEEEAEAPGGTARDCGDFSNHCESGFTFFRRDTQVRAAADQTDATHEWIYLVYDAGKPSTETDTGTTYGTNGPGRASQAATYFTRLNGADGSHTTPVVIDDQSSGHQVFPDISADQGVLHALWWDSRNDPSYDVTRPIGNDEDGLTTDSLDVWGARSEDFGVTWIAKTQLTDERSNPNYEQFDNRSIPFAGDYLWVTSLGDWAFGVWTDWRNTVAGSDPREAADEDNDGADVKQCRTFDAETNNWSGDQCPHDGGIDQDIFGDLSP
jgi:hypothetical protein